MQPDQESKNTVFNFGLDWVAFFAFAFGIIVLFWGDPDLHDVLIQNLSDCQVND